ncbi:MAG: mechanosensitive ion channel family protein [Methanobrevibacter sp.]|jgi:small conductance mechanosensitive channel|nr:mechanosensitive ion channel family protein [Candidatus Methanovirga aequatorialis]
MYLDVLNGVTGDLKFSEILMSTAILVVISLLMIRLTSFIVNKATKKFDLELTVSYLIRDSFKYLIYICAVTIQLEICGVDVTGIVWSLGIVGISLGFAGRDMISNFISGIFILSDKTIKVGEVVEVDDVYGKVHKVGFRTTTLVTFDNSLITIPNSVFSSNPYVNHTYLDEHRIDLDILIPYKVDLIEWRNGLNKRISHINWVLNDPTPKVFVKEFNEEGVKVKVIIWAKDYFKIEEYRLILANEIRKLLKEV